MKVHYIILKERRYTQNNVSRINPKVIRKDVVDEYNKDKPKSEIPVWQSAKYDNKYYYLNNDFFDIDESKINYQVIFALFLLNRILTLNRFDNLEKIFKHIVDTTFFDIDEKKDINITKNRLRAYLSMKILMV